MEEDRKGYRMALHSPPTTIPEDLSVMGHDDLPLAEFLSLTTMWQHHDQLARNAARRRL